MRKVGLGIGIVFFLVSFCWYAAVAAGQKNVAPGAPTALRLVIVPDGFKLTWQSSPEDLGVVTGYEIVRSDLASGPFATVATVDKGVSQYIDTTASPEIIYYYKVRAVAGAVYSPYSNTVTGER
jgi:hypothetical protein